MNPDQTQLILVKIDNLKLIAQLKIQELNNIIEEQRRNIAVLELTIKVLKDAKAKS